MRAAWHRLAILRYGIAAAAIDSAVEAARKCCDSYGGHLSIAELKTSAHLFGGVQLLTLPACNTGVGDGAAVEGVGTLAQRQGAKAVVASLWPVANESTALLMREFYLNIAS